jgi:hypothetical protein
MSFLEDEQTKECFRFCDALIGRGARIHSDAHIHLPAVTVYRRPSHLSSCCSSHHFGVYTASLKRRSRVCGDSTDRQEERDSRNKKTGIHKPHETEALSRC